MKTYKTEVLLSITTGFLMCDFGELHECCEYLMQTPIFTHQFAHRPLWEKLKQAVLLQHPQLSEADTAGFNKDNWLQYRRKFIEQFGPTFDLSPNKTASDEEITESFVAPLVG